MAEERRKIFDVPAIVVALITGFVSAEIAAAFSKYNLVLDASFGITAIAVTYLIYLMWRKIINNSILAATTYFLIIGFLIIVGGISIIWIRQQWINVADTVTLLDVKCEYRAIINRVQNFKLRGSGGDTPVSGTFYASVISTRGLTFFFSGGNERMILLPPPPEANGLELNTAKGEIRDADGSPYTPPLFITVKLQSRCN